MAVGNFSLPSNILQDCGDGFVFCISLWANNVTDGLFWAFALLAFAVILFMGTARLGNVRAYGYASFVGMVGAIWLVVMGLLSWTLASAFILNGILGLAIMIMSEKFNTL